MYQVTGERRLVIKKEQKKLTSKTLRTMQEYKKYVKFGIFLEDRF